MVIYFMFVRHSSHCVLVIKLLFRQDSLLLDVANQILTKFMRFLLLLAFEKILYRKTEIHHNQEAN